MCKKACLRACRLQVIFLRLYSTLQLSCWTVAAFSQTCVVVSQTLVVFPQRLVLHTSLVVFHKRLSDGIATDCLVLLPEVRVTSCFLKRLESCRLCFQVGSLQTSCFHTMREGAALAPLFRAGKHNNFFFVSPELPELFHASLPAHFPVEPLGHPSPSSGSLRVRARGSMQLGTHSVDASSSCVFHATMVLLSENYG